MSGVQNTILHKNTIISTKSNTIIIILCYLISCSWEKLILTKYAKLEDKIFELFKFIFYFLLLRTHIVMDLFKIYPRDHLLSI